jgi:hypothetical protein
MPGLGVNPIQQEILLKNNRECLTPLPWEHELRIDYVVQSAMNTTREDKSNYDFLGILNAKFDFRRITCHHDNNWREINHEGY